VETVGIIRSPVRATALPGALFFCFPACRVVSADFHDLWTWASLISRPLLVSRRVRRPCGVDENLLHSCSKTTFTWRNEVTGVSVFNIVVACL
jgi:hypothetical protein